MLCIFCYLNVVIATNPSYRIARKRERGKAKRQTSTITRASTTTAVGKDLPRKCRSYLSLLSGRVATKTHLTTRRINLSSPTMKKIPPALKVAAKTKVASAALTATSPSLMNSASTAVSSVFSRDTPSHSAPSSVCLGYFLAIPCLT